MNGKSLIVAIVAIITLSLTLVVAIIGGVTYIAALQARVGVLEKQSARPDPFTGKDAVLFAVDLQNELKKWNPKINITMPMHHPSESK